MTPTTHTTTDGTAFDLLDRAAVAVSGALVLLGVVGLGVVEVLAGRPYGAAPLTDEAGEVVASPAVDPAVRTGLVVLGLAVLLLWGCYRMAAARLETQDAPRVETTAD